MGQWTLNSPPTWYPTAVATDAGWVDPDTGMVLIAISRLASKAGAGDVLSVAFGDTAYDQGDNLSVIVRFNEKVDVAAGASIVVGWSGVSGDITLYAAAQTGVDEVVFNKKTGNVTQETVPEEAGILSIGAQTLGGTVIDNNSAVFAGGVLTLVGNPLNGATVTVGSRTYTFQTTLTNTNGNVKIGATKEDSAFNLASAINRGVGRGTTYATATTVHADVIASGPVGAVVTVTAKASGVAGNSIATTETLNTAATGTIQLVSNAVDTKIVTIGSTVYTFQDTLTNVAGNVKIGEDAAGSIANLVAAITAGAGSGTAYAAATTAHATVTATGSTDTATITAKTGGTAGNSIALTTDVADAVVSAATLLGGVSRGTFGAATLTGGSAGTATTKTVGAGVVPANITVAA